MDRPLDPDVVRRQRLRRAGLAALLLVVTAGVFVALSGWIRPAVERSRIRTAVVERGPVQATLSAPGTVAPTFEQVLASPLDGRVREVLAQPGRVLAPGDPIVRLDVEAARLALADRGEALARHLNRMEQARLEEERADVDLAGRAAIAQVDVDVQALAVARVRRLYDQHLASDEDVRGAELTAERARLQRQQLADALALARRAAHTRLDGLALEADALRRARDEARRDVDRATVTSDRRGVLTWVTPEPGAAVRRGDVLARVADLSAFRVEASVSDVHAGRLAPGQRVAVRIDTVTLGGTVTRVRPTVVNGAITVEAALDRPDHPSLRANLRVDVYLVADEKRQALRLRRGAYADGTGTPHVFVLHGAVAVRTPVRLGLAGVDHVEVVDGLAAGDEVIVSDMSAYAHLERVKVR